MIVYAAGFKYQLLESYMVRVDIRPDEDIETDYIALDTSGALTIRRGYAWDGPSGPTLDTKNFMRGSLVHDALYQLLREGHLPKECRSPADQELRRICREDGMSAIRAWWVYKGVSLAGGAAASPSNRKPVFTAP